MLLRGACLTSFIILLFFAVADSACAADDQPRPPGNGAAAANLRLPPLADLVAGVVQAVVTITASGQARTGTASSSNAHINRNPLQSFFDGTPTSQPTYGCGFLISADGLVLTTDFNVKAAATVAVTLNDGNILPATVIGFDTATQTALLKVSSEHPLPFLTFAHEPSRMGDWILSFGDPYHIGQSVFLGVVSGLHRDFGQSPYDDFLQIDSAMNKGDAGGPVVGVDGKVVGMNVSIYSPTGASIGLGFVVPADVLESVASQLRARGKVERASIGVSVQDVTSEIAAALGLPKPQGAIVTSPWPANSPPGKAALEARDIIVRVSGQAIRQARDLSRVVGRLEPGARADIVVWRSGKELTETIQTGRAQ